MRGMRAAVFVLLVAWPLSIWSATDYDLYRVSRLVSSQSTSERARAVRDGLGEVLVRVSGRAQTLNNPGIKAAIRGADRLLLEYSYAHTKQNLEQVDSETGVVRYVPAEELVMRFAPSVVEELLRRNGEPILPRSLPVVLCWIVIDDGRSELVGPDSRPDLINALTKEADRRGVRFLLPLLDLDDSLLVSAESVWQYDLEALYEASRRYGEHSLLIARIFVSSDGKWVGDWRYELAGEVVNGDHTGSSDRELLGAIVDEIAEQQSVRFAVFSTREDAVALSILIDGVDSFEDYMSVRNYLASLTAVREAKVTRVDGSAAEFAVFIDTSVASFEQEIRLGAVLQSLGRGGEGRLRYQLMEERP